MTEEKLLETVLADLPVNNIHPLHRAMLAECCEKVIESANGTSQSDKELVMNVHNTFLVTNKILKGTFRGALDAAGADNITLNYRGQEFSIGRDSGLLKDE